MAVASLGAVAAVFALCAHVLGGSGSGFHADPVGRSSLDAFDESDPSDVSYYYQEHPVVSQQSSNTPLSNDTKHPGASSTTD